MANREFQLMLLEDAEQFLASLPDDARLKITYNIRRVLAGEINKELFAKLDDSDGIWDLEHYLKRQNIGYFLFGIKRRILLSWQHMVL